MKLNDILVKATEAFLAGERLVFRIKNTGPTFYISHSENAYMSIPMEFVVNMNVGMHTFKDVGFKHYHIMSDWEFCEESK